MSQTHIAPITNRAIWEDFVLKNASHSLFQSYLWGEVINSSKFKNQSSKLLWRLGIFDGSTLVGVIQVQKVVAKRGVFLHARHGPILAQWNTKVLAVLVDYLKNLAKQQKAIFIRISPLIENSTHNRKLVSSFGFRPSPIHAMDGELCWALDITKETDTLLSMMRKTTRYLVRQSKKYSVQIKQSSDIGAFLKLYEETAKRHNFVPHKQVAEEFSVFSRENKAVLFLGYAEQKLISGAIIVFYGDQAIYRHGASRTSKAPVSYILQWEAIQEAKKRNFSLYNFWGIAPHNKAKHPWSGITLFKKGFGGHEKTYIHAHDLPLSPLYWLTFLIDSIRKAQKGY